MYRCESCGKSQKSGVPSVRVVTKTRSANYMAREDANRRRGLEIESRDDPGGSGTEIAEEKVICPPCEAELLKALKELS